MPRPRAEVVLAGALLCALMVVGVTTVAKFRLFADVDERAHFAYVQEVAEEQRIPRLDDQVPWQTVAIGEGTWPRPSPAAPASLPFGGVSYEAFQPPLYYVVAAPVFAAGGDHRDKVFVLRAFGLLLHLVAVGLTALLARAVFGARWVLPFCLALAVLVWPGLVARSITVSNHALELPLAVGYVLAVWIGTTRASRRALVCAGALLGACLLTKLTSVYLAPLLLAPVVACLRAGRDRRTLLAVAAALVLPLAILAPWLAMNVDRYGTLTADERGREVQEPVVNPTGEDYGLDELRAELPTLLKVAYPTEWWKEYFGARGVVFVLIPVALLLAAALALIRRRGEPGLGLPALLFAAPVALGVLMIVLTLLVANWGIFLPRFLHVALPGFALFAALAVRRATRSDVALGAVVIAIAAATAFSWVWGAGVFYFPNQGAKIGIHPR